MAVVIETTIGDFTVDLYIKERPHTCLNFLKLCKIKYYNWSLFHTVQSGFIAQTGDPTSTGRGGESIHGSIMGEKGRYYQAEKLPKLRHDKVGLLSMVNCGDNVLGSQFFITLAPDLQSLDGEHCVFGEIVEGFEVILKFNEAICDASHRPYQDIRISHTVILDDPYDDPPGLVVPDASPGPTREVLESDRIGADEAIDDTEGLTLEEIAEIQKEKEAKARATMLEIIGDIPDAEIAPPENVLFICKLNPVTNDDDLEIIFGRFGKIIGCEVIRDRQTGDSLQYAFIEFENKKSCEDAYFKMDNVLIDDRRIHVDFSQSVAKMRWRGKGKGIDYYNKESKEGRGKNEKREDRDRYERKGRDRREEKESRDRNGKKEGREKRDRSKEKGKHEEKRDRKSDKETKRRERSSSREKSKHRKRRERSPREESKVRDKRERGSRSEDRERRRSEERERRNKRDSYKARDYDRRR